MNQNEKIPKIIFVLFCLIIIAILFIVTRIEKKEHANQEKKYINNSIVALNDTNRFITINSAIEKYVSNVKYKKVDALMLILDKRYAEENKIDSYNVFDKIENYNSNYSVNIREVYRVKLYNNISIYYLKAKLIEEEFASITHRYIRDVYFKVTINENDLTFAVAPLEESKYLNKVGDGNEGH